MNYILYLHITIVVLQRGTYVYTQIYFLLGGNDENVQNLYLNKNSNK